MAVQLITELEPINVSALSMLIYGPPGAWKTSLAQTTNNPITLDFDMGVHRAFNRKSALRLGGWDDINDPAVTKAINGAGAIVVDTIGRCLDMLSVKVADESPKNGNRSGGLSMQGWGVLKSRFAFWVNGLRQAGKDIIFLCHEKEEKDGDDRIMRPDIQGGSYIEVMKFTDLVGYLHLTRDGKRILDFNPSDKHLGKNAAGWSALPVPDLKSVPTFLGDMLADAKKRIGQTSEEAAKIAAAVKEYESWLSDASPDLVTLNDRLAELPTLSQAAKAQVWHLILAYSKKCEWTFDSKAKKFVAGGAA